MVMWTADRFKRYGIMKIVGVTGLCGLWASFMWAVDSLKRYGAWQTFFGSIDSQYMVVWAVK